MKMDKKGDAQKGIDVPSKNDMDKKDFLFSHMKKISNPCRYSTFCFSNQSRTYCTHPSIKEDSVPIEECKNCSYYEPRGGK